MEGGAALRPEAPWPVSAAGPKITTPAQGAGAYSEAGVLGAAECRRRASTRVSAVGGGHRAYTVGLAGPLGAPRGHGVRDSCVRLGPQCRSDVAGVADDCDPCPGAGRTRCVDRFEVSAPQIDSQQNEQKQDGRDEAELDEGLTTRPLNRRGGSDHWTMVTDPTVCEPPAGKPVFLRV